MKKNINKYEMKDDYAVLSITNQKGKTIEVIVDKDMVDTLKGYSFRENNNGYIKTGRCTYMQRLILKDIPRDMEIDHINRNKLDNRKSNLRIVSHKDNCNNRYKDELTGINKIKRLKSKPYQLRINGKHIGYYATIEEALLNKKQLTNVEI